MNSALVTLYGSNYLTKEWTVPCVRSWEKIINIPPDERYVIGDMALSPGEVATFDSMGLKSVPESYEELIEKSLKPFPSLTFMRTNDCTWKKILDTAILFRNKEKVVVIDTDVYIKDRVLLPLDTCDIAYMRDEVPAYQAKWSLVWKRKMVPALNAGLIIFNPAIVDFAFLDKLALQYLRNCSQLWWSEQSGWACLVGLTERRMVFDGRQVKVVPGFKNRSAGDINRNKYFFLVRNKRIESFHEFQNLLIGGSIFHFSGPGKKMFTKSLSFFDSQECESLVKVNGNYEPTLTLFAKLMISLRLFGRELSRKKIFQIKRGKQ